MGISTLILVWALDFTNLGNYKSFNYIINGASPIESSKNNIFVFDKDETRTLEVKTAKQLGKFKLPSEPFGTPMFHDGILYYYSSKGFLTAYSLKTATTLWTYKTQTLIENQFIIYNSNVLIAYKSPNHIIGLDINTGKLLWSYKKDIPSSIIVQNKIKPLIVNNTVFIAINNYLIALNALTGIPILEKLIPSIGEDSIMSIKKFRNNILFNTYKGNLFLVNNIGNTIWKYKTDYFVFATQNNNIILATKDKIINLNNNGIKTAEYKIKKAFPNDIKLINNMVIIANNKGLMVFDISEKKEFFTFNNNTGMKYLLIKNKNIIVLSNKNITYSFNIRFKSN